MKNKAVILTGAFVLVCSLFSFLSSKTPVYKHAVKVTFKSGVEPAAIEAVDASFGGLQKLKVVKGYEWGVVDSKNKIKHIYIFSFAKPADLEIYANSPEHQT